MAREGRQGSFWSRRLAFEACDQGRAVRAQTGLRAHMDLPTRPLPDLSWILAEKVLVADLSNCRLAVADVGSRRE